MKKVLLVEPNYKNKYPPIGLMKLATYHRELGYDVTFYKGSLKGFIVEQVYTKLVNELYVLDSSVEWYEYKSDILQYLEKGRKLSKLDVYEQLLSEEILNKITKAREYIKLKKYLTDEQNKWDRVCITTLFTFHFEVVVQTINDFKHMCKDSNQVLVGGISATVLPEELESATGVKVHQGLLDKAGVLDSNDIVIDELPLDYSILEEIDYEYPESDGYYGYMTRGCINECAFCVVPLIEPNYNEFKSLKSQIEYTREMFGEKKNLMLLDSNVLASQQFENIINEIIEMGFGIGDKYKTPNMYEIAIARVKDGYNIKGYLRFLGKLYTNLLQGSKVDISNEIKSKIDYYRLNSVEIIKIENVLESYGFFSPLFEKYYNKRPKVRVVDFNQGLEGKLLSREKVELLSKISIKPLRIAFDHWSERESYNVAIRNASEFGIKTMSNYLLYNFKDTPIDLYRRLRMNIELCEELGINIYSFPMKYHPITDPKFFSNRDYIGVNWNRKYVRSVQAILNTTKGKVGRGSSFFYEAFGNNEDEFTKLLLMPETLIIYRFYFKENGVTEEWWQKFSTLSSDELEVIKPIIFENNFAELDLEYYPDNIKDVLKYYLIKRVDVEKEIFIKKDRYIKKEIVLNSDSKILKI